MKPRAKWRLSDLNKSPGVRRWSRCTHLVSVMRQLPQGVVLSPQLSPLAKLAVPLCFWLLSCGEARCRIAMLNGLAAHTLDLHSRRSLPRHCGRSGRSGRWTHRGLRHERYSLFTLLLRDMPAVVRELFPPLKRRTAAIGIGDASQLRPPSERPHLRGPSACGRNPR